MTTEEMHNKIDQLEELMYGCDPIECKVTHEFFGGYYLRTIFMPKGAAITSMIHKTNHLFFMISGKVRVFDEFDGEQIIEAPYVGITKCGTRRVLHILEDCIWSTRHSTDIVPPGTSKKDIDDAVDKICDEIIEQRVNPLLGGVIRNNKISSQLIENQ